MTSSCSNMLEVRNLLQLTLSTLAQPHFLVFEPLSFPIYNIVVIIIHSREAGLLPHVDNHSTSGPKSLEKSRGT